MVCESRGPLHRRLATHLVNLHYRAPVFNTCHQRPHSLHNLVVCIERILLYYYIYSWNFPCLSHMPEYGCIVRSGKAVKVPNRLKYFHVLVSIKWNTLASIHPPKAIDISYGMCRAGPFLYSSIMSSDYIVQSDLPLNDHFVGNWCGGLPLDKW